MSPNFHTKANGSSVGNADLPIQPYLGFVFLGMFHANTWNCRKFSCTFLVRCSTTSGSTRWLKNIDFWWVLNILPETNILEPENGWLEYGCFLLGFGLCSGAKMLVSGSVFLRIAYLTTLLLGPHWETMNFCWPGRRGFASWSLNCGTSVFFGHVGVSQKDDKGALCWLVVWFCSYPSHLKDQLVWFYTE